MEIKDFLKRTSVRDFDKKPMPKEDIEIITNVINNSPTSTNAQQFSAIIFTNQEDKNWFSEKNWNQQHIADSAAFILFVADRHRSKNSIPHYANEGVAVHEVFRGIVDATIAATYAHDALITMGYGVTFVGGVATFADEIEKNFKLPRDVQPILALSIGKATKENDFKPKMNKVFLERYDGDKAIRTLEEYNEEMIEYYKKRGQTNDHIKHQANNVIANGSPRMIESFANGGKYIEKHLDIAKKK